MAGFNSIDGIVSGLNTTEIINAIMQAERIPAVYLERQQAEKTNMVASFKAFEAKLLSLQTAVKTLQSSKTYEKATIDISDDAFISATATGRVSAGSYDLQVLAVARNHQIASQGVSDESQSLFGTGTITITLGNGSVQTITIDSSSDSLMGIKDAINEAEAGVTATIIRDGSSSNPYRLIITGDKTGLENTITIDSSLTGGFNLNYSTAIFDSPELLSMDSGSDSAISLGGTASYTGDVNKIYTFTVAGIGAQTVGTDNITINWTDGTDSGSIVVTQADTEFDLAGSGSDGLKLTFASGDLTAGDTFQVTTFAPLLQEAEDAKLAIGSAGGTGSPITITSDSNSFEDVIGGVNLTIKKETDVGDTITITTDIDVAGIKGSIQAFITAVNGVSNFVDEQNEYDQDKQEIGILFGDYTLQTMQSSLRRTMGAKVEGLTGNYTQLYSLGIRTNLQGDLTIKDSTRLTEAIRENLDDVIKLFTDSGTSSNGLIDFIKAGPDTTLTGEFEVDITQAATQAIYEGELMAEPEAIPIVLTSSNNVLKLNIDGLISEEIVLSVKTYNTVAELVNELQNKIDADDKIGEYGVVVEWVDNGANDGYLRLTGSNYGSRSKVALSTSISNAAFSVLGLAGGRVIEGQDVEGTINGEEAEGTGLYLVGAEDTEVEGIKLKVNLTDSDLVSGVDGTISMAVGIGTKMEGLLNGYTLRNEGLIASRIRIYEKQAKHLAERIASFDERLAIKRERLEAKFRAMEQVLGQLGAQSSFLTGQLASMNSNWIFNANN